MNECNSSNGGCVQMCINTVGSFTCQCLPGYMMDENGRSCIGKYKYAFLVALFPGI